MADDNYSHVLVLDSDTLALRSFDYLLALPEPLVIAHHTTGIVHLVCGLPIERRMISSLFLLRPSDATFADLEKAVRNQNRFALTHYSDQLAFACYFGNASRTLPSTALHSFSTCASINVASCRQWSNTTILRASGNRNHKALSVSSAQEECRAVKQLSCNLLKGRPSWRRRVRST